MTYDELDLLQGKEGTHVQMAAINPTPEAIEMIAIKLVLFKPPTSLSSFSAALLALALATLALETEDKLAAIKAVEVTLMTSTESSSGSVVSASVVAIDGVVAEDRALVSDAEVICEVIEEVTAIALGMTACVVSSSVIGLVVACREGAGNKPVRGLSG